MHRALLALLICACQSAPSIGAACTRDSECSMSLACRFGRCRSECATARDCPIGARCIAASGLGVCTIDVENHCDGHVCPSPLACVADQCRTQCTLATDCMGGTCTGGTCEEAISGIDAGVMDGGLSDAGPLDVGSADIGTPDAAFFDGNWPDAFVAGQNCLAIQTSSTCDTQAVPNHVTIAASDSPYLCWFNNSQGGIVVTAVVRYDTGEVATIGPRAVWTDPTPHCMGARPHDEVAHVSVTCNPMRPYAYDLPIHCP